MNSATNSLPARLDPFLRAEIEDLYARYSACVDSGHYEAWPGFFTETCTYKVIPRENHERGLPLATLAFESRAMLEDRVYGITQTLFHQPYYQRHSVSGILITEVTSLGISVQANYLVIRTRSKALSEVFNTGRYIDRVVREDGALHFAEKCCVFDSEMIPNSIIYPI
jgi:salicylate 5-hydroxylase small subunit